MADTYLTTTSTGGHLSGLGNNQHITAGGSAVSFTVEDQAEQHISSGGVATYTTVSNGGMQIVSAGGIASRTFNVAATQIVGGDVDFNVAAPNAAGYGRADGTTLDGSYGSTGEQHVRRGGVAHNTVVNTYGEQHISSGGAAISTVVSQYGSQVVSTGGLALAAILKSDGKQLVSTGGVASNTTINDGDQYIYDGGIASNTTINRYGAQCISEGGKAFHVVINDGGSQYVSAGALASGTVINAGGNQSAYGVTSDTTVNSGGLQFVSGGSAVSTRVNSGGSQYVYDAGSAFNTTVASGGWLWVGAGGQAHDANVLSGGRFGIGNGGSAIRGTVASGGAFYAGNGANVIDVSVAAGAYQYIDAGAIVMGTPRPADNPSENMQWWNSYDASFYSGPLYIRGTQYVAGKADNLVILGRQYVKAGGVVRDVLVSSGGLQVVSANGTTYNTSMVEGTQILSGGVAHNTRVAKWGGSAVQVISARGVAVGTSVYDGVQNVMAGGTARNTMLGDVLYTIGTIFDGSGSQFVYSGGVVSNTTIGKGVQTVLNGGVALNTTVRDGGYQRSSQVVSKGGVAHNTVVYNGGHLSAYAGAVVSSLTLHKGARAYFAGGTTLYGNNTFTSATIDCGTSANPLKLANTATLTLGGHTGNFGTHLAVNSGHLKLTGTLNFASTLKLTAKSRITYDVSKLRAAGKWRMLQIFTKSAPKRGAFSVNVGKAQDSGVYELSINITHSKGMAYTVKLGNSKLGSVKLGGAALTKNGATYKIAAKGAHINLTIGTKAGKMLKGNAKANTLKGTAHCDVFYGGRGNDKIYGNHGRDVAVYNKTHWGKDIIAKTKGGMTLLFNGMKASDIVQKASGANLVITRKGATGQSITIQGYNAASHKIIFGSGLKAVDKYLAAAKPTTAQTNAARNQIWKKAGLA